MRSMRMHDRYGRQLYLSTFDRSTGVLVRTVEDDGFVTERFRGRSGGVPSPSPELVDVSITSRCSFACPNCYQDSRAGGEDGAVRLVEQMLQGFETVPYQIAIGGGEPTLHPDFPYILRRARQLGTIPNYTTAGFNMTDSIVDVTNECCGGVALTYHLHKGWDWFRSRYEWIRQRLRVKLNIHLIADNQVVKSLNRLVAARDQLGPLSIVLLAYYPDVGRARYRSLMTRSTYMRDLPVAIRDARALGVDIAFSEGLLPFFLSRSDLGVNTDFATRGEGWFSCYVDHLGRMAPSSFGACSIAHSAARYDDRSVFTTPSQELWQNLWVNTDPDGEACDSCPDRSRCSVPHDVHYLMCARARHNLLPLPPADVPRTRFQILQEDD